MVKTGLEVLLRDFPLTLKRKRLGVLCHAPSIDPYFNHITDILSSHDDCFLSAIFGPQHGLYGQTQDNMIEWQSQTHPLLGIPLYSLYGENRKPTAEMLENIDALIIDLQDVGARLYTYIWTVKLCIEACSEAGIPVWILDRPNPIGAVCLDGPVLKEEYFTFVGGASIPMCHRMTIGEMALWIRDKYYHSCDLNIVWMEGWKRNSLFSQTGLPWVLPSPNMPTENSAIVYPGTVLIEALNLSEGRGTTIPFELFGAPFIDSSRLRKNLESRRLKGCAFREHGYIPTFHKYAGEYCNGLQLHVTDVSAFRPVETALHIFDAIMETSPEGSLLFKQPPYEYEYNLMPFDILSGDAGMRQAILEGSDLKTETERWQYEIAEFKKEFKQIAVYSE
jgi:uncharacterized protein YbbC (DUF1343 family)